MTRSALASMASQKSSNPARVRQGCDMPPGISHALPQLRLQVIPGRAGPSASGSVRDSPEQTVCRKRAVPHPVCTAQQPEARGVRCQRFIYPHELPIEQPKFEFRICSKIPFGAAYSPPVRKSQCWLCELFRPSLCRSSSPLVRTRCFRRVRSSLSSPA